MPIPIEIDGSEQALEILARRPALRLGIDGWPHELAELPAEDGAFEILLDGVRHRGWRIRIGHEVHVRLAGRTWRVALADPAAGTKTGAAGGNEVRAEMPGTVTAVQCRPGAQVRQGDALMVIESMKLQMTLTAPFDAQVAEIHVAANGSFERNALLVSLTPAAAAQ